MQQEKRNSRSAAARVIAAVIALIVIGGSIFAFVMPRGENKTGWLGVANAFAESWKILKKGSSGAQVRQAQQALSDLGYYTGRVDGNFSRAFEEAVIAFQRDFGLKETGALDRETYLFITEGREDAPGEDAPAPGGNGNAEDEEEPFVVKGEEYSDKDHVAAYLHAFEELPPNYITKRDAQYLGWENRLGNLWEVAPGKSIGGDRFGNYEGQLPDAKGRKYFECDIDFDGGFRGPKRIIYSSDGLIFYTEDHYTTFEEIIFEE